MPLRSMSSGIGEGESRKSSRELFFFGDLDFDFGGDIAEDFDLHGEVAEGFDWVVELDLALVNLEALGFESFGDVPVGDRAEELVVLAGLARELELDAVERGGLLFCGVLFGGGFLRQRAANALERLHVAGGGFDGQFVRQQEIARVARLHVDDVAAVAELFDVFLENYFLHLRFLLIRILSSLGG
jgi:hypothetical protein